MGSIGAFFGQVFGPIIGPIGQIFHVVFYLPIYNVLMLLYLGIHAAAPALPAYAIAIFFLTIIIRLALFPLTRKQLASSRKMQELAPQVQEIQRRHKGDPQATMAAQQALYREHGVSMYGGCLPLLVQLPFLYGLYYSLYTALLTSGKNETVAHHLQRVNNDIYPFLPHLSALPNTHFLWTNLAAPDPLHILPILAGVLTFVQLRMAMPVRKRSSGPKTSDPNSQAMGTMQYIMPFFTFFIALNFPSGLAFYWAISTGFSAVQQYFISGWGSLFVGIPGLEHLVPAPTTPTVPTSTARPQGASAFVDSTPPASRPTGIAGLRQMLAEMAATRAQQANNKTAQEEPSKPPAASSVAAANDVTNSVAPASANGTARRNRPQRQGPTLVKPVPSGSPTDGAAASTNGTSAAAGVSAGTAKPLNGANGANGANSANGGNATSKANGVVGPAKSTASQSANGTGPRPQRPAQGQQRSTSGGSAARKRSGGKAKGGR